MGLFKRKNGNSEGGRDLTTSKIYIVADWIWKLFVINTLTLVTCIGVITILPAFVAAFRTIKQCSEQDETHYIKAYYRNFVYGFKDTVVLGIVTVIVLGMLAYAYVWYSEVIDSLRENGGYAGWLNIYSILLGFVIVFTLLVAIAVVQFPMIVTYFHFRFIDKIRFSYYMAFKYLGTTLIEIVIIIANTLLLIMFPYWGFVGGLVLPLFLIFKISRRIYWSTASLIEVHDEEDQYDIQGKTQQREVYEDKDAEAINSDKIESKDK